MTELYSYDIIIQVTFYYKYMNSKRLDEREMRLGIVDYLEVREPDKIQGSLKNLFELAVKDFYGIQVEDSLGTLMQGDCEIRLDNLKYNNETLKELFLDTLDRMTIARREPLNENGRTIEAIYLNRNMIKYVHALIDYKFLTLVPAEEIVEISFDEA